MKAPVPTTGGESQAAGSESFRIVFQKALLEHLEKAPVAAWADLETIAGHAVIGELDLKDGTGSYSFVGTPPDWYADPDKDWLRGTVLHRMQHWPAMLRVGLRSHKPDFAQRVILEWEDWLQNCPCPFSANQSPLAINFRGPHPWRLLDAGIRLYESWIPSVLLLEADNLLTDDFLQRVEDAIILHADYLAACAPIDARHDANNHIFMQMLGLMAAAFWMPEHPRSRHWLAVAQNELLSAVGQQFTGKGSQIEGCPHYHNLCVDFLCRAAWFHRMANVELPDPLLGAFPRMLEYTLHSTRSNGDSVPWGDSDALRLGIRLAAWSRVLFGDDTFMVLLKKLIPGEEWDRTLALSYWDMPSGQALLETRMTVPCHPDSSMPLRFEDPEVKQASLRSGWSAGESCVFLGCQVPVHNAHAHADPAGFDFTARGRGILVDPGRYTYAENAERRIFKSVKYHNCLVVNDREPFDYLSTWSYGEQGVGELLEISSQITPQIIACQHDCYDPVVHRRLVCLPDRNHLLVVDWLSGLKPADAIQVYWHWDATDVQWHHRSQLATADFGTFQAILLPSTFARADSLDGFISDVYGSKRASRRLRLWFTPLTAESEWVLATGIVLAPHGVEAPRAPRADFKGHDRIVVSWETASLDYECQFLGRSCSIKRMRNHS